MDNHNFSENVEIAAVKSNNYGLFSAIFLGEWDKLLSHLPNMNIDANSFYDFLLDLKNVDFFDIKVQYDNLFVAPGKYFVSPYISSYVNHENEITSELSVLIKELGISICDNRNELPDHLGCILAIMQLLTYKEKLAWEKENVEEAKELLGFQKQFIEKYLFWISEFTEKVNSKLEYGFVLDATNRFQEFLTWQIEDITEKCNNNDTD